VPEALDPLPLLRFLHERGIKHIVIGGFAVNAHGFIRVTKDLDTGLAHLRAMKRAAGRPQDLEDLRRLDDESAGQATS
jgi:hypothetical protein